MTDTLYLKVYEYYKNLISQGKLKKGEKLPSIRKCSENLDVSRTTVESAYLCLAAEGYIISKPQSGYYVSGLNLDKIGERKKENLKDLKEDKKILEFSSVSLDERGFDFNLWQRYIKSALRQRERLISYGDPQGEEDLREALKIYLKKKRNVIAHNDSIIIGAGIQPLLAILCVMLKDYKSLCFLNKDFRYGRFIFETRDFEIHKEIRKEKQLIYTTPSLTDDLGGCMPLKERLKLLETADDNLIIEDDYNNEFAYDKRSIPAIQGLDTEGKVIYMGGFSKLLLPSIRIAYMVLPEPLLKRYKEVGHFYNQTASVTEQIALCQFIRDGHLESHIRKTGRYYRDKQEKILEILKKELNKNYSIERLTNNFMIIIQYKGPLSKKEFQEKAMNLGLKINTAMEGNRLLAIINCTSLDGEKLQKGIEILNSL